MREATEEEIKELVGDIVYNMTLEGLVTYDPATDSVTITEKGLTELLGKHSIN